MTSSPPYILGMITDPLSELNVHKDSSIALMHAAEKRGWLLLHFLPENLYLSSGTVWGKGHTLQLCQSVEQGASHAHDTWYKRGAETAMPLGDLTALCMRKDPPVDSVYWHTTHLLDFAARQGVLVVNQPQALRDANEKLFIQQFPQCCPPTVVSSRYDCLRAFVDTHVRVVMKPLDGMGGRGIFNVTSRDPNLGVILETMTRYQRAAVMAQAFLPAIFTQGDKRVTVIQGCPVPYALARYPASGESRGNLAAGGHGEVVPLTPRDRWLCEQIAPALCRAGIVWAGVDIIGEYITEVNVTSPTCIRELDTVMQDTQGETVADQLMNQIVKLQKKGKSL